MTKVDIDGAVSQFTTMSTPDKLVFTFRGSIPFDLEPLRLKLRQIVCSSLGWSTDYADRHVKTKLVIGSASANGPVTNLQVTYLAASLYREFPHLIIPNLTELECKAYIIGLCEKEYANFLMALEDAPHGIRTTMIRPGAKGVSTTKGKERSLQLGNSQATRSGLVYRRPEQHVGFEAHIRAETMKAVVTKARVALQKQGAIPGASRWEMLVNDAKAAAWRYLLGKLDKADFDLDTWIDLVSRTPTSNGPSDVMPLVWRKQTTQDMFALADEERRSAQDWEAALSDIDDAADNHSAQELDDIDHAAPDAPEKPAKRRRKADSGE